MDFIEVSDVVKQYSGHLALDHVSVHVPQGCIYGLLGPNGAGKTTLIRIINMITRPDSGQVLLDGKPLEPADVARIGYLPEERGLYKKMKVADEIVYLARLKGLDKATAVQRTCQRLERFGLTDWAGKKVESLSKGMQQKVQFIATVLHEPRLLIFDEPFSGFDPVNAEQLKQEILHLQQEGATILFSTHNMESVEEVCQRITLINHSRVVLEGDVEAIKQQHKQNLFEITLSNRGTLPACEQLYDIVESKPGTALLRLRHGAGLHDTVAWLNDHCQLAGFNELLPSMNEIFIETVKNLNS